MGPTKPFKYSLYDQEHRKNEKMTKRDMKDVQGGGAEWKPGSLQERRQTRWKQGVVSLPVKGVKIVEIKK